jgi:hypothetical protein
LREPEVFRAVVVRLRVVVVRLREPLLFVVPPSILRSRSSRRPLRAWLFFS